MIKLALTVIWLSAPLSNRASAQAPPPLACSGHTQYALERCAKRDYDAAHSELTRAFQRAVDHATGEDRRRLLDAQSKYLEYEQAHCAWVAALYRGGSMEHMQVFACLAELDRQRVRQLAMGAPD